MTFSHATKQQPSGKPYHAQKLKSTEGKTQYSFLSLKSWHPTLYHKTQIYSNKLTVA